MKKVALYNVKYLKEKIVKPYLKDLNINCIENNSREWFQSYVDGCLHSEDIQAISNYIENIILLIYLDNAAVQMLFPSYNDFFFIKEVEKNL
jgi:hypothetical protein